jgi:hypothetical protein
MFRFEKANTTGSVDLVFQFCNTYDSFVQFNYAFTEKPVPNTKSRTVSGLDPSKPINCTFQLITDDGEGVQSLDNNEKLRNTYVVSLFRLPHLATDVVYHAPFVIVKVLTKTQVEYWYVLGVRKVYEYVGGKRFKKVMVRGEEYKKELFRVSGNIPADLLRALGRLKVKKSSYLHALCISEPSAVVDNSKVVVIRDS